MELTEEQRKRMEENRQKALAKRAAALAGRQPQQSGPGNATNLPASASGSSNASTSYAKPNTSNLYNKAPITAGNVTMRPQSPQRQGQPQIQKTTVTSPKGVKLVGGTCTLISRSRFVVTAPYHPGLINILKNISGGKYDPTTKKWDFPLSEHGNLMTAVNALPGVTLGALPSNILNLFRNPEKKKDEVDMSLLAKIDQQLVTSLFEFQKVGVCFGINNNGRLLLADDMGLGKTIQALGIAHYYYEEWPLLIATPSSMRFAWREAIWKWLPTVPAGSIAVIESSRDVFYGAKVVILSYDLLQRRSTELQKEKYKVVIIDESHHLKNYKTARAKAALPMIQQAKRAILLSGTPALSRPIELYTQLSSIDKNCVPPHQDYGIRYCNAKKTAWGWDFSGSSNMEELQIVLTETVMMRRMKSDVLAQLPAKRRKTIPLDLGLARDRSKGLEMTKTAFNQAKASAMEKRGKLLEFYAETGRVKLEAAVNYVKDLIEQDKKFLCFAHHREVLDGVSKALDSMKIKYIRIDGTTSSEERHFLCDQFQFRDDIKVAVLSITAASCGITLTAAHLVLFLELFWNPGILCQAEDRAHRIGQEDSVLVEYLVAPGTADDILWPMVANKLDILNKAGLSKDNFREADVEILKKKGQTAIDDFFDKSPTSAATEMPSEQELEMLLNVDFEDESTLLPAQNVLIPQNSNAQMPTPTKKPKF